MKPADFKKIFLYLFVVTFVFSCSKKDESSEAASSNTFQKTNVLKLNSAETDQAIIQSQQSNINYKVKTINTPSQTKTGYKVNFLVKSPNNRNLYFTTLHENGQLDVNLAKNDGLYKVKIHARCSADDCFKYLLLISILKDNLVVYQNTVISYVNDCRFHSAISTDKIGKIFSNLNDAENFFNVAPLNDRLTSENCPLM